MSLAHGPLVIAELGISNLASVNRALDRVGAPVREKATAATIAKAGAIIVPGVGAFADGIGAIRAQGLEGPLKEAAARGVPVLGICLGMHLLVEGSDEFGQHQGVGLIKGWAKLLAADQPGFRVPNIGWCEVTAAPAARLFPAGQTRSYYHVHSYWVDGLPEGAVAARMNFSGRDIPVAYEWGNIFGAQFHPEKSQAAGLDLLAAFLDIAAGRNQAGARP